MMPPARILCAACLALSAAFVAAPVAAQNPASCDEITGLVSSGQYADALYEIDDCRRNVQTLLYDGAIEAVNRPVAGLQPSGGSVEGAMGITVLTFGHGDFESSYTSGSGAAENPMASLAGLAGLSSALGIREEGVEEVRLGRRTTGRLEDDNGRLTMTVAMDDGVLVTEGRGYRNVLIELVTELMSILEDYFGG
jgi:hypothetical protein